MKTIHVSATPVAVIQATREEYQEQWLQETAAGGITLENGPDTWYWISPTGVAFLFVLPQIGQAASPQAKPQEANIA